MAGVGGTFLFTFKAAKPGTTGINLENVRPGEKATNPVNTFALTIEVDEKERGISGANAGPAGSLPAGPIR